MDTWDVIGPVCREKEMEQTCGEKQRLWSLWATELQREISLEFFPVFSYDFHGTQLYLFCNIISGYEIPVSLYVTTEILLRWIPCLFSAHSHWAPPLVQWLLGTLRTQFSLPGMPDSMTHQSTPTLLLMAHLCEAFLDWPRQEDSIPRLCYERPLCIPVCTDLHIVS